MTFAAFLENRQTKVLIDTGSFVTLIDSKLASELSEVRAIKSSLRSVVGIGGVNKDVHGAIIIAVKVNSNRLLLKCQVVDDMPYPIVLGREMMNIITSKIDYSDSRIHFKSRVSEKL